MAAVERLAETDLTDHPLLVAFLRARRINSLFGGILVKPWELVEHPDFFQDWIYVADALEGLQDLRRRKKAIEKWFAQRRAEHPTYNRYRH